MTLEGRVRLLAPVSPPKVGAVTLDEKANVPVLWCPRRCSDGQVIAQLQRALVNQRIAGIGVGAGQDQRVAAQFRHALVSGNDGGNRDVAGRRVQSKLRAGLEAAGVEVADVGVGPTAAAQAEGQRAARVDRELAGRLVTGQRARLWPARSSPRSSCRPCRCWRQ